MERDVGDVGSECLTHVLTDALDQRIEVEVRRERLPDAVHGRELGDALARFLHEPRVLERDAEAAGHRHEELLVRLVERVLAIDVLERDRASRLATRDEGDEQHRFRPLAGEKRASVPLGLGVDVLGKQQRLARLQHVLRESADWTELGMKPLTSLDEVGVVREPGRLVERGDDDRLGVEDVSDPFADGVVDRLRLELACDRVLHAVDQRQLRVPLPRLVHEAGVLECDAEAARERLQQLLVRVAERMLAVDVLE